MPGDESAVPPNNGGRSDDEEHLGEPMTVDGLRQHGEDRAVGLAEAWAADLTLQDQDLMPQSEDLGIASIAGQHEKSDTGHQQTDEVGNRPNTAATVPTSRRPRTSTNDVSAPSGCGRRFLIGLDRVG